MKKVLVIVGPTGVGKTAFSIELAKQFQTEIISGDSIQIYRGLDIGSGKVTKEEMEGIPHHLIDEKDPNESYTVVDFQQEARSWMEQIDFPMIVGGTGLYLKACLYDYIFEKESSSPIEPELETYSNEELYKMLVESDPIQAQKIHPNNHHRLLRSLTIQKRSGVTQSELIEKQSHQPIYDAFVVGCTMPREQLYQRIDARVEKMFQEGLVEEVKQLLEKGYTFSDPGLRGIGYQEFQPYFLGECSLEKVKEEIQKHSRQYAKRQYTWFHHQMDVHWMDVLDHQAKKAMIQEIQEWKDQN